MSHGSKIVFVFHASKLNLTKKTSLCKAGLGFYHTKPAYFKPVLVKTFTDFITFDFSISSGFNKQTILLTW
jgi:hypothetical protein